MNKTLQTIIKEQNLKDNNYEYKNKFADLYLYRKDNHVLMLEKITAKTYNIYGNFLMDKDNSLNNHKLYKGLQLDLFYNQV